MLCASGLQTATFFQIGEESPPLCDKGNYASLIRPAECDGVMSRHPNKRSPPSGGAAGF
jgi:hypothetical protein